ncbi:MAG: InlB B-repeat-containing protein [Bacteroidaceae bacterium]|nr:InlB B-repeat-containing protein [Bacteroidaceae bacterium]
MKRKIISWLMLLLPLNLILAQETHWQCNIYDFQYDMTAYLDVTVDGNAISDYSNYEVAAFCGEECRGLASLEEIPNTEKKYYYLRIRSNQNEGETISFKVYDKAKAKEYSIAARTVTFSAQSMQGYPSSPMVLSAANRYRLIYVLDGVEYSTDSIAYGTELVQKDALVKEGYTFSGWSEIPVTMPAQNVTVEGTFTVNCYRLVYLLDGVEYSVDSIAYGTELVQKESLTKEGHTFSGWSEIPATMPAQDVTVEGSFTVNSFRLVYLLDGAEYSVDSIAYGTELVLKESLTKEGHTFSGWSEIPATMPADDVTIEGKFTVNSYRLVYLLDGAEYSVDSIAYGTELVQKESLTKEGHTFSDWSEIPATMPAQDVTVEGTFTINRYTLLYMVDGAEYKTVELEYGASIIAEAVPAKEGHTFSGWSEIPATMPAQDLTVTGSFTVNSYTITYKVDGEVYATEEVAYGEVIVLKEAPEKDGYIFSGWSEVPETMPAEDLEVTGSFASSIKAVITKTHVDVYSLQGMLLKRQILVDELKNELPQGIYIVDGKKILVK